MGAFAAIPDKHREMREFNAHFFYPELVFGRAREGAFDSKASSRKLFTRLSDRHGAVFLVEGSGIGLELLGLAPLEELGGNLGEEGVGEHVFILLAVLGLIGYTGRSTFALLMAIVFAPMAYSFVLYMRKREKDGVS